MQALGSSNLTCRQHSPPGGRHPLGRGTATLWLTQFGIVSVEGTDSYTFVSPELSPGGYYIEGDTLWVTELRRGELLRVSIEEALP